MIERERRDGSLTPVLRGRYASDDDWNTTLDAFLARGGPQSCVSHRAAAHLHGLDGFDQQPSVEITVAYGSTFHHRQVHRSRHLSENAVVMVNGRRVTNLARTLFDLAAILSRDDLEIALESAIRSKDPKTPAEWNFGVLERLESLLVIRRQGVANLRAVLGARPIGCRPTGSWFETRAVQALRLVGLGGLHRQPTLSISEESTGKGTSVYPDLGCLETGTMIELDGEQYHRDRRVAERKRDNLVGSAVRILRYDSTVELSVMAREVKAIIEQRRLMGWPDPAWWVTRTDHSVTIRIPR